jgi:cell division protein ZapE
LSSESKKPFSLSKKNLKKSIYIWGGVGRGKTMLVNKFLDERHEYFIRYHYIEFIHEIHDLLNSFSGKSNPMNLVLKKYQKTKKFLFVDEFQVEDVTDAMILRDFIIRGLEAGILFILTSNSHPKNLYLDGLQRNKFKDAINKILESFNIIELKGSKDYRNQISSNSESIDRDVLTFIRKELNLDTFGEKFLSIGSRKFPVTLSNKKYLWLSFNDFFNLPVSSHDFKLIVKKYDLIIINSFDKCDDTKKDIIRRFITFIDLAYKEKVKIKFFMDFDLDYLYSGNELASIWQRCKSRINEFLSYKNRK